MEPLLHRYYLLDEAGRPAERDARGRAFDQESARGRRAIIATSVDAIREFNLGRRRRGADFNLAELLRALSRLLTAGAVVIRFTVEISSDPRRAAVTRRLRAALHVRAHRSC